MAQINENVNEKRENGKQKKSKNIPSERNANPL